MQTQVEKINSYSKKLKVEVTGEELHPIEEKIIRNFQKKVEIPGFRPGKAPLNIIRQRHRHLIQQELVEEALRNFYNRALNEADINPVSEGKITDFKFDNIDTGMQFDIEVEVEPEIELKKYKGLQADKDVVELTDEMVDEAMEQLREQYATTREVDQAEEGHYVHFEVQELDKGGIPVVGHKYENLQAKLGSGEFDPEIETQLVGIKKGESRIVRKEVPTNPSSEENGPQINSLEVRVDKIEEKEFPELDNEFVKNLEDDSINTLDELRTRIRQNMEMDFQQRSEKVFQNRLIDELLKENPFEVPPSMVENYLNEMTRDIKKQAKGQEIDPESVRKEYRASAIHNLRWYFLKKILIDAEHISVDDQELMSIIDNSGLEEKVKNQVRKDQHYLRHLKEDLMEKKIMDLLREHADITEVYPLKKK